MSARMQEVPDATGRWFVSYLLSSVYRSAL